MGGVWYSVIRSSDIECAFVTQSLWVLLDVGSCGSGGKAEGAFIFLEWEILERGEQFDYPFRSAFESSSFLSSSPLLSCHSSIKSPPLTPSKPSLNNNQAPGSNSWSIPEDLMYFYLSFFKTQPGRNWNFFSSSGLLDGKNCVVRTFRKKGRERGINKSKNLRYHKNGTS